MKSLSHTHPEALKEPEEAWQVKPREHHKEGDESFYIPERVRSELRAKASGALLALSALIVTWVLSILFATRFAHIGLVGFNVFLTIQFLLWAVLRQGMSIIALVAFDIYYTTTSPNGQRKSLSLYALDAWMSLIITPINVFRGKFTHVLLVLLPSLLSIFAAYATSGLLGRETAFQLHERGLQEIDVGAAGGGSPLRYIMTGQEFLYNASQGCLTIPNHRFVFRLENNKMLIPSIPNIGTYVDGTVVRAASFNNVPSIVATLSTAVESNRTISPPSKECTTTVPNLGEVCWNSESNNESSATVKVKVLLRSHDIHKQIYLDIHYRTAVSDLLFATFNNGSHINQVFDVRNVSEELPSRLRYSKEELAMGSVVDNFVLSQNGETLLKVASADDTRVIHLGLLLASSFGIRSATRQNWMDGAGELEARVFEEREVVKIPVRYWAVAGSMSGLLALACLIICIRRTTINGNLVQIVALLNPFIEACRGACTPNWQKAYAQDKTFEDTNMNERVTLGYAAKKNGGRAVFMNPDKGGEKKQSYRIAFDAAKNVTKDKLSNLYGLLAG